MFSAIFGTITLTILVIIPVLGKFPKANRTDGQPRDTQGRWTKSPIIHGYAGDWRV